MNIFFKRDGAVVTPPLSGSILPGVTRDSVLTLLRDRGIAVEERRISIDEVMDAHAGGTLEEVFGSGTAAVISPVGVLEYQGTEHTIADGQTGTLARRLFDELMAIQYGQQPDPFGWIRAVDPAQKKAKIPNVNMVAV